MYIYILCYFLYLHMYIYTHIHIYMYTIFIVPFLINYCFTELFATMFAPTFAIVSWNLRSVVYAGTLQRFWPSQEGIAPAWLSESDPSMLISGDSEMHQEKGIQIWYVCIYIYNCVSVFYLIVYTNVFVPVVRWRKFQK